jgi:hypothetical protein
MAGRRRGKAASADIEYLSDGASDGSDADGVDESSGSAVVRLTPEAFERLIRSVAAGDVEPPAQARAGRGRSMSQSRGRAAGPPSG